MKTIPTYVIDGILESGKTTFIKATIGSDDFFKKGKTLVLACEEGMEEYDKEYPGYGFAQHKGYGTAQHYAAIHELGISPIHRMSFLKKTKLLLDYPVGLLLCLC